MRMARSSLAKTSGYGALSKAFSISSSWYAVNVTLHSDNKNKLSAILKTECSTPVHAYKRTNILNEANYADMQP